MHEIYTRTIFEPSAKKHLPFFSCFVKKETPLVNPIKNVFPEVRFVPQHFFFYQSIAEDLLHIQSFLLLMRYDV
jgi:hypothetical protein